MTAGTGRDTSSHDARPYDGPERRVPRKLYGRNETEITGPLQPASGEVRYRRVLSRRQLVTALSLAGLHITLAAALVVFLLLPSDWPVLRGGEYVRDVVAIAGLVVMVGLQVVVALRTWTLAYFAAHARDPIPMRPQPGLRVAVLTTIVPGKEPVELVMTTLRAMTRIRHDGPMDVWLLDEGDDPEVRRRCEEIGVRHFSRKGRPEWNQPSGPFRAKTKHGNHNAWRQEHELDYDVVAQMDPDHVPYPNFLERVLGYFADPDTAFVVAPQVYGNLTESFVARGAAELAYIFHGIIQRGANGLRAPLLIGTNHLYRPSAFRQIGGYQDSIIEDHLTSMVIYSAVNPVTGHHWRGVYTPDILAVGEGPATYADFFSQQKRWAYGIWEIARRHSPRLLPRLGGLGQRLSFFGLQSHYPTTAIAWVGGIFLSAMYLVGGVTATDLPLAVWAALFPLNLIVGFGFFQFMRRFNLAEHERKSWGLTGMVLELITAPVYVTAAAAQVAGRRLVYVVTAKGSAATADSIRSFRAHLGWAAIAGGSLLAGVALHHTYPSLYYWAGFALLVSAAPVALLVLRRTTALASDFASGLPTRHSADVHRRVGDILVRERLITPAQLRELLDMQATQDGPWQRLGDLAVARGYVTAREVERALRRRPRLPATIPAYDSPA
jgi:hypothetical protein